MLKLEDYGTVFMLVTFGGALVISWPALGFVLPVGGGERFSALYVLGPDRMAEGYPFDVWVGRSYRVFLGVEDHMGSSAYYAVYVKLRSQDEPLPNSTAGTPSPLPALYEYRFVLEDEGVWEVPVDFSFRGISFFDGGCRVEGLVLGGRDLVVEKTVVRDSENSGYFLQLFFELWIYDDGLDGFSFHDRFVGVWLNMTAQAPFGFP